MDDPRSTGHAPTSRIVLYAARTQSKPLACTHSFCCPFPRLRITTEYKFHLILSYPPNCSRQDTIGYAHRRLVCSRKTGFGKLTSTCPSFLPQARRAAAGRCGGRDGKAGLIHRTGKLSF